MKTKVKIPAIGKKLRFAKQESRERGMVPGELVFIGDKKQSHTTLRLIAYDENSYIDIEIKTLDELASFSSTYTNLWLNIDGLHELDTIQHVGEHFNIHQLYMEDVVHTGQRPKIQSDEGQLFFILKMLRVEDAHYIDAEQFSMILKKNILITFQERTGDLFDPVRKRIAENKGRIRKASLDYLAFCLMDCIVENYAVIMEYFGAKVEELEDKILLQPDQEVLHQINRYKVELNFFRKTIRPTRENILAFLKVDNKLIHAQTKPYFEDLKDSIIRAFELVESYKDMLSEQLTVYSTNVNNRLNDVMKILTIFSAVFIPLTFIAGIYGTNFEYVPELHYKYSYFVMWGVMILTAIAMILFFKKKKWF
jgi:magnesium transporter